MADEPRTVLPRRSAVSEGAIVPVDDRAPDELGGLPLQVIYNITKATDCDLAGHPLRGSALFPDGHMLSPFRHRTWKIVETSQLAEYLDENPKESFEDLHRRDDERRAKYAQQSAQWFEAMGRYVVSFEHVCAALVRLVRKLLARSGLRGRDIADILVADQVASQLVNLAQTLFNADSELTQDEQSLANEIFARVGTCCESRNQIVHAQWLPGGANAWAHDDFEHARGLRYWRTAKKGEAVRQLFYGPKELEFLANHCRNTAILIDDIAFAVARNVKITGWLVLAKNKLIRRVLRFGTDTNDMYCEDYPQVDRHPPANGATDSAQKEREGEVVVSARCDSIEDLHFELGILNVAKQGEQQGDNT